MFIIENAFFNNKIEFFLNKSNKWKVKYNMINDRMIDSFMLCLNTSSESSCISATADMYLRLFYEKINGKIYVFQCYEVDKKVRLRYQDDKVIWLTNQENNFRSIKYTLDKLTVDDIFIIFGGEFLVSNSFDIQTIDKHFQDNKKWDYFSNEIDSIYGIYQFSVKGIITICNVNILERDKICELLEKSENMSISSFDDFNDPSYDKFVQERFDKLVHDINGESIEIALSKIQDLSGVLTEEYNCLAEAMAYYSNGDLFTAINKLEEIYDSINYDTKLYLADAYNRVKEKEKAIQVYEDIYEHNKQQKGLHELGADLFADDDEKLLDILQEGLRFWPDNRVLICDYANYLAKKHNHREAAIMFRKLNTPYYELVARVNDLAAEEQTDPKIIKSYIFELVENNPELMNDAIDKISQFAIEKGNYFNAWKLLNEIDLSNHNEVSSRLLNRKIEILRDAEMAGKALGKLKPYNSERDSEILQKKRVDLLREVIKYYSCEQNGYFQWRDFMKCQTREIWNAAVTNNVIECILSIADIDLEKALKASFINKINDCDGKTTCLSVLYGIRLLRHGYPKSEDIEISVEDFIKNGWVFQEVNGSIIEKTWFKYYCSIISSFQNNNSQKSINYALSIFEGSSQVTQEELELETALFLMSWGNIQYRLGNVSEGIVCVVESIYKLISINELIPVLEEGLSIIALFLGNDIKDKSLLHKAKNEECLIKLSKYNESFCTLVCSFGNEEYNRDMIEKLISVVTKDREKDIDWLIALANLISLLVSNGRIDDAVVYITDYYDEAERFFDNRSDIVPKILHSWGHILASTGNLINLELAFRIYDEALLRCEKRNTVHHQEERAALSFDREKIIRDYVCYCGMYYSCSDVNKETKESLRNKLLDLASRSIPLSIIEQKKYNHNCSISEELKQKNDRLVSLKHEYNELCKNNDIESEIVQKVAKEIESITDVLIKEHPNYRALQEFKGTDWKQLQDCMKDSEVVYQYILTEMAVISVLVTNTWIDVRCKIQDSRHEVMPYVAMEEYINVMENAYVGDKLVSDYSINISLLVAEHLCEYVWSHDVKNVYVIPDISKSRFPISAVQYENEFLIDKVDSISNFIDYRQLCTFLNKNNMTEIKILNKIFGKKEDPSIDKIIKYFKEEKSVSIINDTSCSDSFDSIKDANSKGINTLAIYGHGLPNIRNIGIDGAQCIQGAKRTIDLEDILESSDFMNLILISCLGGSPNSANPETSRGTWANIFEKIQGNILTCIWSVPTVDTIELMDCVYKNLIDNKMDFGMALLYAQKKLKNNGKNQLSWAGVEHWIN